VVASFVFVRVALQVPRYALVTLLRRTGAVVYAAREAYTCVHWRVPRPVREI
jgi:hypothetical protein